MIHAEITDSLFEVYTIHIEVLKPSLWVYGGPYDSVLYYSDCI